MAIRTDIYSIDWDVSPRRIWIDISVTEANAQDLYDTVRYLEALPQNLDDDPIIDAAGGEPLGGGVKVGLTVSLLNAQYAFADRPGPEWVVCNMSGGNVVAFTDSTRTVELYPRYPTAFVSADRTASSSATTQEQSAIQYSSFNDRVAIDPLNVTGKATTSTDFPAGTRQAPAVDLATALAIANKAGNGFKELFLESDLVIESAADLSGFVITGNNHVKTRLSIGDLADVSNLKVLNCTLHDTVLDGDVDLQNCIVYDISYLNGHIHECGLGGVITLGGSRESVIESCYTVDQDNPPIVDMGGSGNDLALPNYSGIISIRNLSSASEEIGIGLNAGMVIIDATITAGTIIVAGNGVLEDNSGPGANVNSSALLNLEAIQEAIWGYEGPSQG